MSRPLLEMRAIAKRFGGVRALDGAELSAERGEILGLCGENGAGKSTLLKILSGVYGFGAYEGELTLEGRSLRLRDTTDARRNGIAIVHQELMLIPGLTVAENLLLGREPRRFGLVDDAELEVRARAILGEYGFSDIDPSAAVGELGIGVQQVVEIVRALSYRARVLVLDEPTAALTSQESERLLEWLRALKGAGTTCIYVSHRMEEVFALCDRVTVLRDGRTAGTRVVRDTTPREIVSLMVGRDAPDDKARPPERKTSSSTVLEVARLSLRPHGATFPVLDDVSFRVSAGEVVAVCGAMGSGRTALLSTLFGCGQGAVSGSVTLAGSEARFSSPQAAIARGVALVPEDRKGRGVVLSQSIAENLALPWLASPEVFGPEAHFGLVDPLIESQLAKKRIRDLSIRGAAEAAVLTLSGGNQQKVVLGKWLARPPRLLLLDEPTRGVDVGAREEIYALLEVLLAQGVAVVLVSSDLTEVLRLSDRILILRRGRIVSELEGRTATIPEIVSETTGARTADESEARRPLHSMLVSRGPHDDKETEVSEVGSCAQ